MAVPINAPPIDMEAKSVKGVKFKIERIIRKSANIFRILANITTFLDHPTPIVHPCSTFETGNILEFIALSRPLQGVFVYDSPHRDRTFY